MRLRIATLVVLAALGGCASQDASSPALAPPSVAPSSPGASSAAPLAGPPSGSVMSVRGTLKDGVEPGCVLLATDAKTYLLIGGDRAAMKSGQQVTVYGTPQPDLMTTCQQGTPFKVTKIEP
ncbi:hypothetical protein AB0M46_38300 [Dactylosporangium sp. NPDC051485]|uniref:hypothetical protein n=1 Tax=Dactylosporangium sp. NPDC051485 TaxID=3154846 RepID=UPI00343CD3EB